MKKKNLDPDYLPEEETADSAAPEAPAAIKKPRSPKPRSVLAKDITDTLSFPEPSADEPAPETAGPLKSRRKSQVESESVPTDGLRLTLRLSGERDERFSVQLDDSGYWCGDKPPYGCEIRLDAGEHHLRVRLLHDIELQPSPFTPLPLDLVMGTGGAGECGPYFPELDCDLTLDTSAAIDLDYRGGATAQFSLHAGQGIHLLRAETDIRSTPHIRRMWKLSNYAALGAMLLPSCACIGLGTHLLSLPGTVGAGVLLLLLGTVFCFLWYTLTDRVNDARKGLYAPEAVPPLTNEPTPSRAKGKKKDVPDRYDGAYDHVHEMSAFENGSDKASDELSPENIRREKERLMRELNDEPPSEEAAEAAEATEIPAPKKSRRKKSGS